MPQNDHKLESLRQQAHQLVDALFADLPTNSAGEPIDAVGVVQKKHIERTGSDGFVVEGLAIQVSVEYRTPKPMPNPDKPILIMDGRRNLYTLADSTPDRILGVCKSLQDSGLDAHTIVDRINAGQPFETDRLIDEVARATNMHFKPVTALESAAPAPETADRAEPQYPRKTMLIGNHLSETVEAEVELETDGRYLCVAESVPGVMAYGATDEEAVQNTQVLYTQVLADRSRPPETSAPQTDMTKADTKE